MSLPWKTLRLFISSTFKDMLAERDHLVRFVFPKLREELLRRRIHFIDVDLRWGVTSDQDAIDVCREVIDECHPRFMGMLGGRYGSVPSGQEHSITADEIHYGVLSREAIRHGNAFFYFRDEQATATMVEERTGEYREAAGSEGARKLAELKLAIVNAYLPAFTYYANWDADQKRLTGLEAFGHHVLTHLLQNIQADPEFADRFAGNTETQADEFAEERDAMEAFIENRTERYVIGSRQSLLDEINTFAAADGTPNIFVLAGAPGSGKSALLGKVCQSLACRPSTLLIPHFVGASAGSTDLRRMLRRLCHELWTQFGFIFETLKAKRLAEVRGDSEEAIKKRQAIGQEYVMPEETSALISTVDRWLKWIPTDRRIILVFDALNQLDATDYAHLMHWLPQELPPNIRIIASSLEHPTLEALRNRGERVRFGKLEHLSETDAHSIIENYLRRYSKRLSAEQIASLLAKPESHLPLYLLTALEELRTLGNHREINVRIGELPGGTRALFAWILRDRLSNDPGFCDHEGRPFGAALVTQMASCLGVSRRGLSQEELTDLLDPGDPLGNVAALLRLLRPYLMHRGELLDFFHGQLREAVESEYLPEEGQRRTAHRSLANYFHDVADPNREGRWKGTSTHAFSELPYHQTRAEAWPELVATLENIFFLEAKAGYGMAFELAGDFSDLVQHLPPGHPQRRILTLIEEAFRRDIHFIATHPLTVFQCLWNTGWWQDCSETARHYVKEDGHWNYPGEKVHVLLERWREAKETAQPDFPWLRSLRPPAVHLGTSQKLVLSGHENTVNSVSISPDGRRIASGSEDNTVRLWDAQSGVQLAVLKGHKWPVSCVGFSPDGRHIVSSGNYHDDTVRLWDAETGSMLKVLHVPERGSGHVSYSPDGRRIVSGSTDKILRVWDVETDAELVTLSGHEDKISSVIFSPDGRRILSGSIDKTIRLWDAESGGIVAVLVGHTAGVASVSYSPDGRHIVSGSNDKTIRIWDAENKVELALFRGHESTVCSVAFSPDGRRIASGSDDTTVRVWDAESGEQLATLWAYEGAVPSVKFSPDGRRIVGSIGKTVRVWDSESGAELALLRGHKNAITCCSFSRDGTWIASGGKDDAVRVWEVSSGKEAALSRGHDKAVTSLAFSPDGRNIVSGSWDGTVRIWDARSGAEVARLRSYPPPVMCVSYSPDGLQIVSGTIDGTVVVWDVKNRVKQSELSVAEYCIDNICFSPDGGHVAIAGHTTPDWDAPSRKESWSISILDFKTGATRTTLHVPQRGLVGVSYSPDGLRIVSGSKIKAVWNALTYERIEVKECSADLVAFAGGSTIFPFWLLSRGLESVLEEAQLGRAIDALPLELRNIATHPSGRIWAGNSGNYLALFQLEGVKSLGKMTPEEGIGR